MEKLTSFIKNHKLISFLLLLLIVVIVYFLIISFRSNNTSDSLVREIDDTKDNKEYIDQGQNNFYPQGSYKVGTDLPAGTYVIEKASLIEIETEETLDSEAALLEETSLYNVAYVEVSEGEYLVVDGEEAEIIPVESYSGSVSDTLSNGIYLVGIDLEPGEYQIIEPGEIEKLESPLNSSTSTPTEIIDQTIITLNEGDYVKLSGDTTIEKLTIIE